MWTSMVRPSGGAAVSTAEEDARISFSAGEGEVGLGDEEGDT